MAEEILFTQEGYDELVKKLDYLVGVRRAEVTEQMQVARSFGDLSENAEYDAAKDEQRDIEARIEEIEKILKNAEVFVEEEASTNAINVGCKVVIHDIEYDEDLEFAIVGSTEANSLKGKISNESPLGHALIGATKGQVVTVEMPNGLTSQYKVLDITRNV